MKKKIIFWKAYVGEECKGEVYKQPLSRRWVWQRTNGATVNFGQGATMEDVRGDIARLSGVWSNTVEFRK